MAKVLKETELRNLNYWLMQHDQPINYLHRHFSDALNVAKLLKHFYPKMVDLNNYPPRCNTQLKLINWETLNQKVLIKLGLCQSKKMLEKYAKSQPDAVLPLLHDIMLMESKPLGVTTLDRILAEREQEWKENNDIVIVKTNKPTENGDVQIAQKMIRYSIYEKTLRESFAKDTVIKDVNAKIAGLKNEIIDKTEVIENLLEQLSKFSGYEGDQNVA